MSAARIRPDSGCAAKELVDLFATRLELGAMFLAAIKLIFLLGFVVLLYPYPASAQEEGHEPILVDEFGRVGDCDFTSRLDNFLADLSLHPGQQGYIINYKSVSELPGAKDTYARETLIRNHIEFRKFDSSRVTFIRGGYKDDSRTQLYRAPIGIAPPEPSDTVPEPRVDDDKTLLYDKNTVGLYSGIGDYYDGVGTDLDEFVLESVKKREAEERAAQEAELEAEQPGADEDSQSSEEEMENADEEPSEEEPLSKEQLEAERFKWAESTLPSFISTRKKASAVWIFYADDQRYDIAKLKAFIEQGRDRMAEKAGMKARLFKVEFGGYRDFVEVEFWFVPAKGKPPVPKPDERKPDEPEPDDVN